MINMNNLAIIDSSDQALFSFSPQKPDIAPQSATVGLKCEI
jgi:hypothetical protein